MTAPTALLSALAGTTAGTRDATGEVSADAAAAFMALLTQAMPVPAPVPLAVPVAPATGGTTAQGTEAEGTDAQETDTSATLIVEMAKLQAEDAIRALTAGATEQPAMPAISVAVPAPAETPVPAVAAPSAIAPAASAPPAITVTAPVVSGTALPAPAGSAPAETAPATTAAAGKSSQGETEPVRPESPRWGQVAARRLKHVLRTVTPRTNAVPTKPEAETRADSAATESKARAATPAPVSGAPDESAVADVEPTTTAPAMAPAVPAPAAPAPTSPDTAAPTADGTDGGTTPAANPAWLRHRMNPVTAPTVQVARTVPKPGTTFGSQVREATGEEGSPAIRAALLILDAIRSEQVVEPESPTGAPTADGQDAPAEATSPNQQTAQAAGRQPALPANARVVAAAVAALHADAERPEGPARPKVNAPIADAPAVTSPAHTARPARPEVTAPTPPTAPRAQVDAPSAKPEQAAAERDADTKPKAATPEAAPPAAPAHVSVTEAAARTITTTVDRGESSPQVTTDLPRPATETAPGPRGLRPTGHQVTIELDGNTGDSTRIRVTVHGNAVRATVLSGAEQSGRLSMHADELTRALEDRGFKSANVSVRTAGEGPMLVTSSRSDAGNSQHDERPTSRGQQREAATRDGQRKSATDDRPRQQRRPEPEEE